MRLHFPLGLALLFTATSASAQEDRLRLRRTPVVEVAESAGPAVVNIASARRASPFGQGRGNDEFWNRFFPRRPSGPRESLGSGVIIDPRGLVLTNEHVVAGAGEITVTLADRRTFVAEVVGADRSFDLAVLEIQDAKALPSVKLGVSSDLMPGELVVAIGNPFGLANSVTSGVVSALHRSIEAEDRVYEDFIQTDAAINPGNSGGALLNVFGELIGINTAIYGEANGIGFAIPVDKAKAVVDEVLRFGEVRPTFSGLQVISGRERGAVVARVMENSPALRAGLKRGDLLLDVSGQEVEDAASWRRLERSWVAGQKVRLEYQRDGRRSEATLEVAELSLDRAKQIGLRRAGFDVTEVRTARGSYLKVVEVATGGAAARLGIRPDDILIAMFGRRIADREAFELACAASYDRASIPLVIRRASRSYYVNLELAP